MSEEEDFIYLDLHPAGFWIMLVQCMLWSYVNALWNELNAAASGGQHSYLARQSFVREKKIAFKIQYHFATGVSQCNQRCYICIPCPTPIEFETRVSSPQGH